MRPLYRRGSLPYGESSKTESPTISMPTDAVRPAEGDIAGFQALGLFEYLDTDDRPIFALDLQSQRNKIPVYQNAALKKLQVIGGGNWNENTEHVVVDAQSGFLLDWAVSFPEASNIPPSTHWGIRWTARTLRNKWRIITGNITTLPSDISHRHSLADTGAPRMSTMTSKLEKTIGNQSNISSVSQGPLEEQLAAFSLVQGDSGVTYQTMCQEKGQLKDPIYSIQANSADNMDIIGQFDITRPDSTRRLSSHEQFFQNFDWASTELGPMSSWSLELRRMCNLLMADPRPASMFWGEKKTMMYNEPYVHVTGQKHPGMMGKVFVDAWGEVAGDFIVPFNKATTTGFGYSIDDARFNIYRHDYLEETYYSLSIIPIQLGKGQIA
jgi:hypothetical protein